MNRFKISSSSFLCHAYYKESEAFIFVLLQKCKHFIFQYEICVPKAWISFKSLSLHIAFKTPHKCAQFERK